MTNRPRFINEQLQDFFRRISLPRSEWYNTIVDHGGNSQLAYLQTLQKHTLVRIPFENITQHYSWHRTINVRPQHLFNKIVPQPSNRGGYCMEVNSLFHTVLLSLGYMVYMAGARVYSKETRKYGGFSHCVNIVMIDGKKYMVDVGFGANGPTFPVPLLHNEPQKHMSTGTTMIRIMNEPIPQAVDQSQKVWVYQQLNETDFEWAPRFCFVEFEFLLEDIRGLNLNPWKSPTSWFTQKVIVSRFTTNMENEETEAAKLAWDDPKAVDEGTINGDLVLFHDTLKWRRDGKTKLEVQFENEKQRIDAIWKYFGIELDEEDRLAILGTVSQIK
ncbi:arylamine N-acetyltransferase 3 [Annulohypoxylon maeteangense]|uniref:arylamine N-acetyltransferase 3 n=1 Tax=Annulohypoxylon maeteangense TaxID=1927788 RepID=UPI0020089145|nr:arylamine N-acetyltransferase 3 [Annulohypoxylon maeteangense]KAI0886976.1 arylamine N-acetyltransferase 3 [Annulohypoxylon maeteangense]